MRKTWFNVVASSGHIEASIRGPIGEWGETDRSFIARIEAAGKAKTIGLTINSRGGEVDHALSIFNYLRSHSASVTVKIDGIAASAASIIAMAGDIIVMPANALMMVHSPWSFAAGNSDDLRKAADDLEKFEAALIETYMARTGKDADDIKALLAAETWMTAAEAVEEGFADEVEIIARSASIAMAEASGIPPEVLSRLAAIEAHAEQDESAGPPHEEPVEAPDDAAAVELAGEVNAICAAADRADLAAPMLLLARASGIAAVRAALAGLTQPTGVQTAQQATVSEEAAQASASALARLGLRAINPRAKV